MEYKNVTIPPSGSRRGKNGKTVVSAPAPAKVQTNATLRLSPEELSPQDMPDVMRPREGAKYRYIRTLGRGGMKVVLEVYDNDTMRNVAMALLPDVSTRSQLEQGQFLREARITASLEHPNIVPVHDIGMDSSGSPFFTMKLLRGRTLAALLKKLADNDPEYTKQFTFDNLMRFYIRICNAMAFAHSKGILHLDLKPENIQIGDYGEVLVLDWGLARRIAPASEGQKPSTKTRKMKPLNPQTAESQVNGTPGYMAPEQINGSRHSCSRQTDIYSLGAILYAMITCKNPVRPGTVDQMLRDTLTGNIQRPSERVDREIPHGIEAVVLKAMSLNPEDRYPDVKSLREDVLHFVDGFATDAENAGPFRKALLFMRRHSRSLITGGVILLLTLMLGVFSWREANRTISLWIPVLSADFQKPGFPMDSCSFLDRNFKETDRVWPLVNAKGLKPDSGQWLMFREPCQENIKVSLKLSSDPARINQVEMALISAVSPDGSDGISPKASRIVCRILGREKIAEILEFRGQTIPRVLASVPLHPFKSGDLTLAMTHENGVISFRMNGKPLLQAASLRMLGNGSVYAAVRVGASDSQILRLEISRLAPPENATALLAGDTLMEERLYEQAVRRYLAVDDNRPGSKLAETALQKAYLAAFKIDSAELRSEIMVDIKKRLAAHYPKFNMSHLLTADACAAWRSRDYALAIPLMKKAFEYDPETKVVFYILNLPHEPLPPDVQNMLLKLVRQSCGMFSLDLSNYGLTSLEGIAGMPLISLNCSGNKLTSLKDLKGMKLESLDCSNNRISSLEGMPDIPSLRYVNYSGNPLGRKKSRNRNK